MANDRRHERVIENAVWLKESGMPVEEQIRKDWNPKTKGGLSTSLGTGPR
jgi:hypothetical protein